MFKNSAIYYKLNFGIQIPNRLIWKCSAAEEIKPDALGIVPLALLPLLLLMMLVAAFCGDRIDVQVVDVSDGEH